MAHTNFALKVRDKYQIGDFVLVDGKYHRWTISDYNRSVNGMSHVADINLSLAFFAANGYPIDKSGKVTIDADFEIYLEPIVDPEGVSFCPQCGIFLSSVADFQHYLRLRGEDEKANNLDIIKKVQILKK